MPPIRPSRPPVPDGDLDAALALIAERFGWHPAWRLLSAACAANHDDREAWEREMRLGIAEFADSVGLPRGEVARYILPACEQLRRSPRSRN